MSKTYNSLEKERNDMLQRITVLQAVREVGAFRADIYADSSIKVKYTMDRYSMDMKSVQTAEDVLLSHFGGYSIGEETGKFVLDETNGEAISKAAEQAASYMEKAGKTGVSKTIGYIPIIGDVASFVIDTAVDYKEYQENVEMVKKQFDGVKSTKIYLAFGCSANFVEYDTASSQGIKIVANHGKDTKKVIDRVNEDLGLDISDDEIYTKPEEIWDRIMDEIGDNPEKQKEYNDAIEGGK